MSTIVGTNIEVTNLKYDSDTTSMIISNTGQVTIQGEGTATTNLQQGLIKAWGYFVGSGTVGINDSFNMDALTDNGTGNFTINITNDLANDHGCMSGYSIMDGLCYGDINNVSSAGSFRMRLVVGHNNTLADGDEFHVLIAGDLA